MRAYLLSATVASLVVSLVGISPFTPSARAQDSASAQSRAINIGVSAPYGLIGEYGMGESWSLGIHLNSAPEHKGRGGRGRHGDKGDRDQNDARHDEMRKKRDGGPVVTRYAGLLARYNLTGRAFDDGLFVSTSASYLKALIRDRDGLHAARGHGGKGDVLIGYGWFANNGLNIHLGVGASYTRVRFTDLDYLKADGSEATLSTRRFNGWGPAGELSLGYAF